jgi:hypothetical protein
MDSAEFLREDCTKPTHVIIVISNIEYCFYKLLGFLNKKDKIIKIAKKHLGMKSEDVINPNLDISILNKNDV